MKTTPFVLVNIVLIAILTTALFFVATGVQSESNQNVNAAEYDPWLDCNDDGTINMLDIYYPALSYGAVGDSTKNVNVTNWPISSVVTVWWIKDVALPGLSSPWYSAGGFGHLHVLVEAVGLLGEETVTLSVRGLIPEPDGVLAKAVTVYSFTFTSNDERGFTIPVPSEMFYFRVDYDMADTCIISLSFYLTWA